MCTSHLTDLILPLQHSRCRLKLPLFQHCPSSPLHHELGPSPRSPTSPTVLTRRHHIRLSNPISTHSPSSRPPLLLSTSAGRSLPSTLPHPALHRPLTYAASPPSPPMSIVGQSEATRITSNDPRTPSSSSVDSAARIAKQPRPPPTHPRRSSARPTSRNRSASGGSRCRRMRSRCGRIWRRRRRGRMQSCTQGTCIVRSEERIRMVVPSLGSPGVRTRSRSLLTTATTRPRSFLSPSPFTPTIANTADPSPTHPLPSPTRSSESPTST